MALVKTVDLHVVCKQFWGKYFLHSGGTETCVPSWLLWFIWVVNASIMPLLLTTVVKCVLYNNSGDYNSDNQTGGSFFQIESTRGGWLMGDMRL